MEDNNKPKIMIGLVVFGVLVAVLGIFLPENNDIAFEVLVNNTDLCQFNMTSGMCDSIRNSTTDYYANNSAIQIFLKAHANAVSQNASIQLLINGTEVAHTSGRPLGAAEDNYKTIIAIIPKGSKYKAVFLNFHHYEWYEYPIVTGRNGTLSINQTIISGGGGVSFDGTPKNLNGSNLYNGTIDGMNVSQTFDYLNSTKVNKTGDNISGVYVNNITSTIDSGWRMLGSTETPYFEGRENGTIRNEMHVTGVQGWKLRLFGGGAESGYIFYTTPAGFPGIAFFNQTVTNRSDMRNTDAGFEFYSFPYPSIPPSKPGIRINRDNQTITISNLTGSGNAYVCVDANGKLYRGTPGC